jgi:tubulin-specific chaperone A
MAPATPLAIATSSVQRLVKEEASYHRELEEQTKRIAKLESEAGTEDAEGNREFLIKQEASRIENNFHVVSLTPEFSAEQRMKPRLCCLH